MTKIDARTKILSAIASRGWFTADIHWNVAQQLKAEGLIKIGERYSLGGNRKTVWVSA